MRRRLRVAAAALAAGAALLAGCTPTLSGHGSVGLRRLPGAPASTTAPPGGSVPSPAPAALPPLPPEAPARFFDCTKFLRLSAVHFPPGRQAHLSFDCAFVTVPLDYSQPDARQLHVVLLRVHDDAAPGTRAPLLLDPGGPGGSGVNLAVGLSTKVSDRLLAHYDLVGFDPRGVGSSAPLRCLSDQRKDVLDAASPNVLTAAGFAHAKALAASVAHACSAKYGSGLRFFDTVNTARDMDRIREALGRSRTDYLGFSYGTELGGAYAHLFPSRVGRFVLDGAVDPLTSGIPQATAQLRGFELAFGQFSAWCGRQAFCRGLGSPARTVESLTSHAASAPIPAAHDPRRATPELIITGTFGALYDQKQWPTLAHALIDARGGDSSGLLALADSYDQREHGHYTNIADAYDTISCNDSAAGPSDAAIRRTARSWARTYPVFGLWFAPGLFTCQQWQPQRTVPPRPTAPDTPDKILVVGNLHDPATPYRGAQDLTRVLGNAELLTWNGEGHTSYLNGSSCIDGHVDDYLISGTLPPPHTVCPR